jgi:hypothetical protein
MSLTIYKEGYGFVLTWYDGKFRNTLFTAKYKNGVADWRKPTNELVTKIRELLED